MRNHLLAIVLGLVVFEAYCMEDIANSTDSTLFERFPRSWIISASHSSESVPLRFITGSVEKIRRELRLDRFVDVDGKKQTITYRIPDDVSLNQIKTYVENFIAREYSKVIFDCQGSSCGRSTVWANDIFRQPILVAPNKNQMYWSAVAVNESINTLVSIYVVKRGNQRLYLHLELIHEAGDLANQINQSVAEKLVRQGHVILEGVVPDAHGNISSRDLESIGSLDDDWDSASPLYVVCHLYGSEDVSVMTERSGICADTVAEYIRREGIKVTAFAAGPMAPIDGRPISRVELIAPRLLRSD